MKKQKIIIAISIMYVATFSFSAYAVRQAVFPDGKSLQPISPLVKPNISGNINSTVGAPHFDTNTQTNKETTNNTTIQTQTNDIKTKSYSIWVWIILLGILGVIFGLYKKLKR